MRVLFLDDSETRLNQAETAFGREELYLLRLLKRRSDCFQPCPRGTL